MKPFFAPVLLAVSIAISTQAYTAPLLPVKGNYDLAQAQSVNAWLEIDVNAFENNISRLTGVLDGKSALCVVMKADAYGNGIDLLMPSIIKMGVPCIAIASNEEAKVARLHGYQGRLLRARVASIPEVITGQEYEIEELVGDLSHAETLNSLVKTPLKYHLVLNAGGMNRNGLELDSERGQSQALDMLDLPNLNLVGIMTHFAVEDINFVKSALATFNEQTNWLISTANLDRSKLTLHTANSFATLSVPESHLDMVRVGGAVYGDVIDPNYQKTMSFKSRVASVHFYKAGTKVGYDGTYTLERDSYLANLPFGYADGYRRAFSNKGFVLIRGQKVPVLGRPSMNTTMVDVTNFPTIVAGDEVVIYGKQGDNEISQNEIEEINGALLADLYTVWGNSNPKFKK